jgi:hypothetical protein
MRKTILVITAIFAVAACDCLTQDASADGIAVRKKVRHAYQGQCGPYQCPPAPCPDRYSCYSLYGAYGPYGGAAYWSRYSYGGWGYGW